MHTHALFNRSRGRLPLGVSAALLVSALACGLPAGGTPEEPDAGAQVPTVAATPVPFEPTATQADAAPQAAAPDVSFEGVSFSYDESIAADVTAQLVPEEVWADDRPFGGGTVPQHYRFEFVGGDPSTTGFIEIYPAAEFEAGHPDAAERIASMRDLLATRPALPPSAMPEVIPLMPLAPYIPAFYAQGEYLDFEGGSGVRCLTMFGFAVQPVTNSDLRYVFQGMLGDGAYYVAAHVPVSNPILADDVESVTDVDVDALMSDGLDWEAYITDKVAQLDAQPLDSYQPPLDALDAMIQSIRIQTG